MRLVVSSDKRRWAGRACSVALLVGLIALLATVRVEARESSPKITETRTTTVVLTTQQVIKAKYNNTTQSPRRVRQVMQTKESFNAKSAVESIKEETKSKTLNIAGSFAANVSGGVTGTSGSANVSTAAAYQNLVRTYFKTSGEIETFKSKETITTDEFEISPGDEVVIYTNTTSGGSYSYSWDTSEKLSTDDARPVSVTLTMSYDLTPAFQELMMAVIENNNGISTDKGEWVAYSKICQQAWLKGIRHYNKEVQKQLWTNGLDRYSWSQVKEAAKHADAAPDDAYALATILLGFYNITQPSHNGWAWGKLKSVSKKYLAGR